MQTEQKKVKNEIIKTLKNLSLAPLDFTSYSFLKKKKQLSYIQETKYMKFQFNSV